MLKKEKVPRKELKVEEIVVMDYDYRIFLIPHYYFYLLTKAHLYLSKVVYVTYYVIR